DGTSVDTSIPVIFDNARTQTIPFTNTIKDGTKVFTKNYSTSLEAYKLGAIEIPTILNNAICLVNGKAANCAEKATLQTNCKNNTSVKCRPAVIIANENTERSTIGDAKNQIDFSNIANIVTHGVKGMIYIVNSAGNWEIASSNDYIPEVAAIENALTQSI
ncbi:MAG: hypothetical protein NT020_13055, partial [Chloroflexales bacterium]|nr:hypothetical protein [Chloroflexales bacterium]